MARNLVFTDRETAVDEGLGFPKAYAKLCKDPSFSSYTHSPTFTFLPYALPQQEVSRAKEFEEMFPIIDPKAKPTMKPSVFVSLLWKQLDHLGNAGFDPDMFRIDPFGNVLYFHADSASPLAWDIDHWFPCSRGGLTVPRNLRILQWQVCKKKRDKLEFLIPWWDLQVGVSINQFLSIFASSNSDFRHRAFSWLFSEGESEELNDSHTVDSHNFPQHYLESKNKIGLAPAAVVLTRRKALESSSALKSLDINGRPRSCTPIIATKKLKPNLKENQDPGNGSNQYEAIAMARDSLRQWEETAKMQANIQKLDDEVRELKQQAEKERVSVEDLELLLMKKKRHAEKCRRLAEAQSSYKAMLEKMIRDAMHQSVVYKEQVRLNKAASNALMARLEAQRAICNSAEKELHCKYKQRDELEKQIRPEFEHTRKRLRMDDLFVDDDVFYLPEKPKSLYLPGIDSKDIVDKKLETVLDEDQKPSLPVPQLSANEDEKLEESGKDAVMVEDENGDGERLRNEFRFPVFNESEREEEEDEESREQRGKENIEKWLQMLMENGTVDDIGETKKMASDEIIQKLNLKYPHIKIKVSSVQEPKDETKNQQLGADDKSNIDEMKNLKNTHSRTPPYKIRPDKHNPSEADDVCKETTFAEEALKRSQKTPSRSPPCRVWARRSNADDSKEVGDTEKCDENERKNERGSKKLTRTPPYKIRPDKHNPSEADDVCKETTFAEEALKRSQKTPSRSPPCRVWARRSNADDSKEVGDTEKCDENERKNERGSKKLTSSEGGRAYRRINSSPSLILSGMKKKLMAWGRS